MQIFPFNAGIAVQCRYFRSMKIFAFNAGISVQCRYLRSMQVFPFNVGISVQCRCFRLTQVFPFNAGISSCWTKFRTVCQFNYDFIYKSSCTHTCSQVSNPLQAIGSVRYHKLEDTENSMFCPHGSIYGSQNRWGLFPCYFPMQQQLNYRNIIETECIYCAIHTESLNIIQKMIDTKLLYQKSSTTQNPLLMRYITKLLHLQWILPSHIAFYMNPKHSIKPELSYVALTILHPMPKHLLLLDIRSFSVSLTARGEILCKHFVPFLNLMLPRISFRRRWFGALSISYFRLLPIGCNVQFAADNCIMVQLSLLVAMALYAERRHMGSNFTFDYYHAKKLTYKVKFASLCQEVK
jgi:hypothetical protein